MAELEENADDVFELDRIRRLIDLMKEHDLGEIDLRQAGQRIRLRRGSAPTSPPTGTQPGLPLSAAATPMRETVPTSGAGGAAAGGAAANPVEDERHVVYIKSPMIGTFYSRPNPNAEPYVRVGDHIDEATTVCIIEAMKVFNEIPAEIGGRVIAILVGDEEPVDFGRPLFKVDTRK